VVLLVIVVWFAYVVVELIPTRDVTPPWGRILRGLGLWGVAALLLLTARWTVPVAFCLAACALAGTASLIDGVARSGCWRWLRLLGLFVRWLVVRGDMPLPLAAAIAGDRPWLHGNRDARIEAICAAERELGITRPYYDDEELPPHGTEAGRRIYWRARQRDAADRSAWRASQGGPIRRVVVCGPRDHEWSDVHSMESVQPLYLACDRCGTISRIPPTWLTPTG
jgi:hypothetical protein